MGGGVGGGQLGYFNGVVRIAHVEQVGRAGIVAGVVITIPPHDGGGTADGHGVAEEVPGHGVGGGQLDFDNVARIAEIVEVGRAGTAAGVVITIRPHEGGGAADGHGVAELVPSRGVVGGQLGQLDIINRPGGPGGGQDNNSRYQQKY